MASKAKEAKLDAQALVKAWQAGERTQSSVIDELHANGQSVAQIARLVDRPYRQVFNTVNRKEYAKRPSQRNK